MATSIVADIVQTVTVIGTCWTIIAGINAWKREFMGKRRIELAEQALAQFYELDEILRFVRNPFAGPEEGKSRTRGAGETPEQAQLLDQAYVVFERIKAKESELNQFRAIKFRFMATFGKDAGSIFDDTTAVFHSVIISASALGSHYWPRQGRVQMSPEENERHLKEMQRHQEVFWDSGSAEDPTRLRMAAVQTRLEEVVRPSIEEASKLYSMALAPLWRRTPKA